MSETPSGPVGREVTPPPRAEPPPVLLEPPRPPPLQVEPLDPWISIWTRPRATLRQILDGDPRRSVFRLAALGGVAGALKLATSPGIGDSHPPAMIAPLAVLGGALCGVFFLFLFTGLVRLTGSWLGGSGRSEEIRAALAWGYVPSIWGLLLWLPRAALLGQETFRSVPPGIEGNPPASLFFGLLELLQALIGFWGLLIALKCVGEAHRFSAWRAFAALALAGLILGVPLGLIAIASEALS
jgi:Yip1 domain